MIVMNKFRDLAVILVFAVSSAGAQVNTDQSVISSSGDQYNAAGISMSITIGEVFVETQSIGDVILTQGFQQSFISPVKDQPIVYSNTDATISKLSLYPNPNNGSFDLMIESLKDLRSIIEIRDLQGRIYYSTEVVLDQGINQFYYEFQEIPKGIYLLNVISEKETDHIKVILN